MEETTENERYSLSFKGILFLYIKDEKEFENFEKDLELYLRRTNNNAVVFIEDNVFNHGLFINANVLE